MTKFLTPSLTILLGRVTSSGRFMPVIDGLRCVAISAVVLYHLSGYVSSKSPYLTPGSFRTDWLAQVLDKGTCGVQLFFAISGMILAIPFAEQRLNHARSVSLKAFYLRRLTRLAPPYLINLLLSFVLLVAVGRGAAAIPAPSPATESFPTDRLRVATALLPHLAASAVYAHTLIFGEMSRINGVAWSLEVEVQFYLLAPLLGLLFSIPGAVLRRFTLVAAIVLLMGLKTIFAASARGFLYLTLPWHLDLFLAGYLLADWYVLQGRQLTPDLSGDLLGVVGWLGILASQFLDNGPHFIALPVLIAYYGTFRGRWLSRLFSQTGPVIVGGMCYTIYLYHFYLISAVGRWSSPISGGQTFAGNFLLQAMLILPVVLVGSAVLFVLFEKPFMRPAVATVPVPQGT